MEYCDVICCNVSSLWLWIKGGIQKHKMLMPMKEFSEVLGVCKRGGWSLETLQQLSAECKFPPLQIRPRICNTACLHLSHDHMDLVIHTSEDQEYPEIPETPERKLNPTLCKVLKTPVDATSSRIREGVN